jgi:hypothetical protein
MVSVRCYMEGEAVECRMVVLCLVWRRVIYEIHLRVLIGQYPTDSAACEWRRSVVYIRCVPSYHTYWFILALDHSIS